MTIVGPNNDIMTAKDINKSNLYRNKRKGSFLIISIFVIFISAAKIGLLTGCEEEETKKPFTIKGRITDIKLPHITVKWYKTRDKKEKLATLHIIKGQTEIYSDGKITDISPLQIGKTIIASGYKEEGNYITCRIEIIPQSANTIKYPSSRGSSNEKTQDQTPLPIQPYK